MAGTIASSELERLRDLLLGPPAPTHPNLSPVTLPTPQPLSNTDALQGYLELMGLSPIGQMGATGAMGVRDAVQNPAGIPKQVLDLISSTLEGTVAPFDRMGRTMLGQEGGYPAAQINPETGETSMGSDQMLQDALSLAGLMTTPSVGGKFDPNQLNIFAGPKSLTADHEALIEAIVKGYEKTDPMATPGVSSILRDKASTVNAIPKVRKIAGDLNPDQAEEIFGLTGWFPGADNKWRYEIPDNLRQRAGMPDIVPEYTQNLRNKENMYPPLLPNSPEYMARIGRENRLMAAGDTKTVTRKGPLDSFIEHPELFKAYPILGEIQAMLTGAPLTPQTGEFSPKLFEDMLRDNHSQQFDPPIINARGFTPDDITSVALHETQHGVQALEGFASGGNPERMGQKLAELVPGAQAQLAMPKPYEIYRALMGETEARNVQHRYELGTAMAPESEFSGIPTATQDIPSNLLLDPMWMENPENVGAEALKAKLAQLRMTLASR